MLEKGAGLANREIVTYLLGCAIQEISVDERHGRLTRDGIRIYEPAEFAGMHRAGRLAATILD